MSRSKPNQRYPDVPRSLHHGSRLIASRGRLLITAQMWTWVVLRSNAEADVYAGTIWRP